MNTKTQRITVIIGLFLIATVTPLTAQESVFVILKSDAEPAWTQKVASRPLVPRTLDRAMKQDQVLNSMQTSALNKLNRIRVVEMSAIEAAKLEGVVDVIPNRRIPLHQGAITDDSLSSSQYALALIGAQRAWDKATGEDVIVGVLDTGVDWEHPDLINQLAVNEDEDLNGNGRFDPWSSELEFDGVRGDLNGIDDDGNGYIDDVIGYDFVDQTFRNLGDDRQRDPIPFDEQGHGTSVAGVVAAEADNGIGIAGLARDARVITMRAFDATGNAEEDDIAAALIYAAVNGVHIVNMSFGDGVDSPVFRDVVSFAASMGVIMVASAGNTGSVSRQYPAGYDNVIAVGATNADDEKAFFSSTGTLVHVTAPGDRIVTTAVASRYRTVNGTSFAAPYVAATAALLLELEPDMTANEVAGVIATSSLDLGEKGWDDQFGAGRLRADEAVLQAGRAEVFLTSPTNESEVNPTESALPVIGSAVTPLFDRYEVYVGRGLEPVSWDLIGSSETAITNDTLATIDASTLEAGLHVVRLSVVQKDGRTQESRRRINVLDGGPLTIVDAELLPAWKDDRRVAVLTIETNRPTHLVANTAITRSERADSVTDNLRYTRVHSIAIDPAPFGNAGDVVAQLVAGNGDTVSWSGSFDLGTQGAPTTGWSSKPATGWAGYVHDQVDDVYGDGSETFVMADLSSGQFGPMLTGNPNGGNWTFRDTTAEVFIPRGMGDANGNGKIEIFAHVVGRAVLFEASNEGGNPFSGRIFEISDGRSNAAGMADINGDGLEELLILSDSGCTAYGFRNGQFSYLGLAPNDTPPAVGNLGNRVDEISVATGDVDSDGLIEVAFGDTDGDLIIAEYSQSGFRIEATFESDGVGGSGYVGSADLDGDGTPEFFHGVPDNPNRDTRGEYGRQVWTYTLYKSNGNDSYEPSWVEHFHGVRYGIGYRNGFGSGDIDAIKGDEIILCAFPRLYVFGLNEQGEMMPKLYRPDVTSPRFLTYDFDGNGRNELGFGITREELGVMTDFTFIEAPSSNDRISTPVGVRAQMTDASTVYLSWLPVEGASSYRVFSTTTETGLFRVVDTVTATSITIDTLSQTVGYRFRVSAVPASDELRESLRSQIVDVGRLDRLRAVALSPDTVTTDQVSAGLEVQVRFSGNMPEREIEPTAYVLVDEQENIVARALSSVLVGDSTVFVRFSPADRPAGPYAVFVGSQPDNIGMPTEASELDLVVTRSEPEPELILTQLIVSDASRAQLSYSEGVDASALVAGNYALRPTGSIERIERVSDSTVTLIFSSSPPLAALGSTYSVTVTDVTSTTGVPITTGAGNTMSFVLAADQLDEVFVYPHPASLKNELVTFANLTRDAQIQILDQRFNEIFTITEIDGNGGASWTMRDRQGALVPPGLYYYTVTGSNSTGATSESGFRKLMIVR